MGRRKKSTGKHRRGTGKKHTKRSASNTGSGNTGGAGQTAAGPDLSSGIVYEFGWPGQAPLVGNDHQIAPERAPMELLQLESAPEPLPDNLAAELSSAMGDAPVDPSAPPPPAPEPPYDPDRVTDWDMYMQMAVGLVAKIVLPQWNLTDDEKNELIKSTAHILQDLFPGGLAGRFAPYIRLITVTGIIVITRHKEHGGKFPGIGPKRETEIIASQ